MLDELDREWARMRAQAATLRTVRGWTGDDVFVETIALARNLDQIVAATQGTVDDPGRADGVLRRLVELSATDQLAGRVVLQRLLPGLISRSRTWAGRTANADPCDVAIGAAWLAIRSFDTCTRRRHVAPALISDAMWIGFRRESRRLVETEVPVPDAPLGRNIAAPRHEHPMCALAATVRAAAAAGVDAADLDVIRSIAIAGGPSGAARDCAVTVRTIRNRRDRAARRIRHALGDDWADWSDPLVAA